MSFYNFALDYYRENSRADKSALFDDFISRAPNPNISLEHLVVEEIVTAAFSLHLVGFLNTTKAALTLRQTPSAKTIVLNQALSIIEAEIKEQKLSLIDFC